MADEKSASKPSPSELAALEHAFAAAPESDAYLALANAYLSLERYMEAMVVAKKGVRAQPGTTAGRVLLARIYAAQKRDQKALAELKGVLEEAPADADAVALGVEIHLRAGNREEAEALAARAFEASPGDEAIVAVATAHGLPVPQPPAPEPEPEPLPPEVPAAPAAAPPAATPAEAPAAIPAPPPSIPRSAAAPQQAAPPVVAPPVVAPASAPAQPQASQVPVHRFDSQRRGRAIDTTRWEEDDEPLADAAGAQRGMRRLGITVALLALVLGGWWGYTTWKAERDRTIDRLLTETNDFIRKDTWASYRAASDKAEEILDLDPGNFVAHAYLAYINALRWGEQGEGEDFQRRAREHLERAQAAGQRHGRLIAADAYLRAYSGDARSGIELLQKELEVQGSGQLQTALGIIQLRSGNLDDAAVTLRKAQADEPNSVRVLAALGELHRRRRMDGRALTFYDTALRIDGNHADSLLGKALLILDANEAELPAADHDKLLAQAEEQIDKVLALPEGSASARQLALAKFARAQLLYARGKRTEAEKLETEVFTLDPRNADVRLMRGRRLLRDGSIDEAVTEIRSALEIDRRATFYIDLTRALLSRRGGAREAVQELDEAIDVFPNDGRLRLLLGDALHASRDADRARAAYEKAIELEGGRLPEARAKIGAIWREKGDWKKARETLEEAVKEFGIAATGPNLAFALTELGRVLEDGPDRDHVAAFENYARAMRVADTYAPAHFFLGRMSAGAARNDAKQRQQATHALEAYLDLAPQGEWAGEAKTLLARLR